MISIIIPTLNESDFLPRLLDSIKRQVFKDYELIVADAGSTDATRQIAERYQCRVVEGGLPARGRNEGAKVAKGEILLFLDSDTVLPEGFLETALSEFSRRNLGIAGFAVQPLDGSFLDRLVHGLLRLVVAVTGGIFSFGTMVIMVKRSVHQEIQGFNEAVKIGEDFVYYRSARRVSPYGYINLPFSVSMRRYRKDGHFTYIKYFLVIIYTLLFGPVTSDIFRYQFNHYKIKNHE